MSWLFGFYAKNLFDISDISKFHPPPVSSFHNSNCYVAIGGNENLIVYQTTQNHNKFFICGFGISHNGDFVLGMKDWDTLLNNSNGIPEVNTLNGHYCGIRVFNESIKFFTDITGLREIHIVENKDGWFFSTRLDWLFQIQKFEIDFKVFSSRWLFFNQVSNKSIIKTIIKLNCGSTAVITKNKFEIKECSWVPKFSNLINIEQFKGILSKFILLGKKQRKKISLSLSGGLDSRVILHFLINSEYKNWDCNLFRTDSQMDNKIAKEILDNLHIPYFLLAPSPAIAEDFIKNLFEYIGSTYITESAFTSRDLIHFGNTSQNELIIDGGFGEIWRREFLTRLLVSGKKVLENRNIEVISKALRRTRADIFNKDISDEMDAGNNYQLSEIIDILPDIKEISFGNWLDIFSIKTRLVNYYAPEQGRLDNYVTCYMPFAQYSLLNNLLNIPVSLRKNHRLFTKLFHPDIEGLTHYKLAKGNLAYPFYFTPIMKRIYFLLYSKLALKNENKGLDLFLDGMKEFIMDSIMSGGVKSYPFYEYKNIYYKVNSYYKGKTDYGNYVNWFLTFEVFRQIMEKK